MEKVHLAKPSAEFQHEYLSFYQEWRESGEKMVPWVIEKDPSNFQEMLQFLEESENESLLPQGWVPSSTYWLVREDRTIVGVVNIRHRLTDSLLNLGGHIGYGIRPSARHKGYATKLLELSLKKAKELSITRALLTCDDSNVGSMKTIQNNGGTPDENYIEDNGNVVLRFWIET